MKELKKNYGFFIVGFVVLFYIITLFTFIISSYSNYKKEIKNIILALKSNSIPIKKNYIIKKPMIITKNMKIKKNNYNYIQKRNKNNNNQYNQRKLKNNSKLILLNLEGNSPRKLGQVKNEKFSKNNIIIEKILKRKEFELNGLNYKEALKIDHRNYCQYYYHLLKYNHPISFSFASYNDYNI